MNYFLGLDAGGTKTKAVVMDENSQIIAESTGGPANYHNIGLTQTVKNVYRAIEEVQSKAFLDSGKITWCAVGIAGCDTKKDFDQLTKALTSDSLKIFNGKLTVVNDAKVGLYSGTLPPGIVVVCGTGSNVYGKNVHGEGAMTGNWGHFLGDKGSGYNLAQRMFAAVVAEYDGTGEATKLTQKLEARLSVSSPKDILDWYNDTRPSVHEVSDFVPLIIDAAEEGDEVAKQLVDETVAELGKALMAVVKRLKMENESNRVVIVGGLFESKYFRALFEGHLMALLKHARLVKPLVEPAVGAAIMAKHEWGKADKLSNSPIAK